MPFQGTHFFGGEQSFYNGVINQSLRYNYGDSPYLTRTGDSGNRRTFTFSAWFKKISFNQTNSIFGAVLNGTNFFAIRFRDIDDPDGGKLQIANYSGSFDMDLRTNQVFRDVTNWFHMVVAVDTTQSTDSDRVKLYINGSQVTSFSTETYPSQDFETRVSNGHSEQVGAEATSYSYIDGYIAEVNFIDGTALTPSNFGETKNGVWIPKAISGLTYGTNGFRLTFADSSALGDDTSGNGNDFTSSGLASTDVVLDSPENNFCVINTVREDTLVNGSVTITEGGLQSVDGGTTYGRHWSGTFGMSSGKWYWEVLAHTLGDAHANIGLGNEVEKGSVSVSNGAIAVYYGNDGARNSRAVNSGLTSYGATYTNGDIIGIAFDADNESVTFYKNNASQGAVGSILVQSTGPYFPSAGDAQNASTYKYVANWGQDSSFAGNKTAQGNADENGIGDFYYSPPSGYLALCSSNLPDTTLSPAQDEQATDYFNTVTYTGDGTSSNAITGVGFQPDWLWIKERSGSANHGIHDSSRVLSGAEEVWYTNATNAANTGGAYISSFDSDGFTLNNNSSGNTNTDTYVAWNWKLNGGTTVSNGNGSITSTTQASTTAGISIVTWTGNFTDGASVGHGLGAVPRLVFIKNRDDNQGAVFNINISTPSGPFRVNFNADAGDYGDFAYYNGTYTSNNIVFNNRHAAWNGNTDKMVAYAFVSVEGFSKLGLYTGNGSTDGPFVFTGFRPAWILFKRISAGDSYIIHDNKRDIHNPAIQNLFPDGDFAEDSNASNRATDFLSNGFKIRSSAQFQNNSGHTYFYMAFAEQPFKFANAR